jgi:hypothetical protein
MYYSSYVLKVVVIEDVAEVVIVVKVAVVILVYHF